MAGHRRTALGTARDEDGRRTRVRLPAEAQRPTARARRSANVRALAEQRLAAEPDPIKRLQIALGAVRSAAAKRRTRVDADAVETAVHALLRCAEGLLERS